MATREQVFRRILGIIGQNGQAVGVIDKALDVYDTMVKGCRLRADTGFRKSVPIIDTSAQDRERERRERREENPGNGRAAITKGELQPGLFERGRALVKRGFAPDVAARIAVNERKQGGNTVDQKENGQPTSQPSKHLRWGATPGAWGNDRLMVEDSAPTVQQATQSAQPRPFSMAGTAWNAEKIDLTRITGHQRAALQYGVDLNRISAADLEHLNGSEMQILAQKHQAMRLKEIQAESQHVKPAATHRIPWGSHGGPGTILVENKPAPPCEQGPGRVELGYGHSVLSNAMRRK